MSYFANTRKNENKREFVRYNHCCMYFVCFKLKHYNKLYQLTTNITNLICYNYQF